VPSPQAEELSKLLVESDPPLDEEAAIHLKTRADEALTAADAANPNLVTKALTRLKRFRSFPKGGRSLLRALPHVMVLLALVSSVLLAIGYENSEVSRALTQTFASGSGATNLAENSPKVADLSPTKRTLLYGEPESAEWFSAWESLPDDHPDKVAYLAEYLLANKTAPREFHEKARALDPDNGWFTLLHSGRLAEKALDRIPRSKRVKGESDYQIVDQASFDEAIALALQAAEQPVFHRHPNELHHRRAQLLGPPPEGNRSRRANHAHRLGQGGRRSRKQIHFQCSDSGSLPPR
jgi:hypothetical protein